ncbi:PREDICTED: interleukin-19 [Chrysochloris asiatica]|uniref:Interleukin family protein n=1 Tax=Chrysochloris asiatica TaxID=185453 RepID=A0A9B0T4Y3_CHRAS|nr:PREDICTED: interleukin-19 [Chrysochloris asiatica]
MKIQGIPLCILGMMLFLCSMHARSLSRCPSSMDMNPVKQSFQEIKDAVQVNDTFKNVTILSNLHSVKVLSPLDTCCMTRKLLEFYVKRVFKYREELSLHISRGVSSISNSFLTLQRTVQPCKEKSLCPCSEAATNATRTINNNYDQLEVGSAAIKSLGELGVFIAWIDKNYHQETSTA